jgi:hypothetical protein
MDLSTFIKDSLIVKKFDIIEDLILIMSGTLVYVLYSNIL